MAARPRALELCSRSQWWLTLVGNIFVSDDGNSRIRKVTATGTISTLIGDGQPGSSGDEGPAARCSVLTYARGIAVDASGVLFFADGFEGRVRKITHRRFRAFRLRPVGRIFG